jgi:hypothetical protein
MSKPLYAFMAWIGTTLHFLGAFTILRKATISVVISVRPSSWYNSTPTGQILMKFGTWIFFRKYVENIKVQLKSDENNGYFTWYQYTCLRQQPRENKNRSTCHLQHTQISSNSSTIAADNSTGTYIMYYSIELISAEYTLFNSCNFNQVYRYSLSVNLIVSITV